MVYKKKIIKFKLNFHKSSKMKASNASGFHHKTISPQLVNAKKLPPIRVSLTPLMPTKLPNIAKEQYYNLLKSSGLLSMTPAETPSWNVLSPEATPERESGKRSCDSDLLSPVTRIQLHSSPVDLDPFYDLADEPWSDSPQPYPSPKSPTLDESSESDEWFTSKPVYKPCSLECADEDAQLLRGSPCDNEVETIMARQNGEVLKDASDIPVHRSSSDKSPLQTIIIPLKPVDKSFPKLDVSRDISPVFEKNGIWTTPARKLSMEKTSSTVEKKDLKRKRVAPKQHKKALGLPDFVDNSDDEDRDPSPLATYVYPSEQENMEKRETNCEGTSKNDTKFLSKKRSVEKDINKRRGRPRKRRRLNCLDAAVQNNVLDLNDSSDRANSTLACASSNNEHNSPSPLTSQDLASKQENTDERERKPEEGASSNTKRISEGSSVKKGHSKKRGRPRKHRRLRCVEAPSLNNSLNMNCSSVNAKSTQVLELSEQREIRGEEESSHSKGSRSEVRMSPVILEKNLGNLSQERPNASKDVAKQKVNENRTIDHNAQESETSHQHTPVLTEIATSSSESLDSLNELNVDRISVEDENQVSETTSSTSTPQRISKWLSAVKIEVSPLIKSLEQNGTKTPTKTTILLDEEEKLQNRYNSESNNKNNSTKQARLTSASQELYSGKELTVNVNVSKRKLRERKRSVESISSRKISRSTEEIRHSAASLGELLDSSNEDTSKKSHINCGKKTSPVKDLSVVFERLPDTLLTKSNACNNSLVLERSAKANVCVADGIAEQQEGPMGSLCFGPDSQANKSPPSTRKRTGLPLLNSVGKDLNSGDGHMELLEGTVRVVPCSPIQRSKSPAFEERQRTFSTSSIMSTRSDTVCTNTFPVTEESNTVRSNMDDKEILEGSSGHHRKILMYSMLPEKHSSTLCSTMSSKELLDLTVHVVPCSPIKHQNHQTSKPPTFVGRRRTFSTSFINSSKTDKVCTNTFPEDSKTLRTNMDQKEILKRSSRHDRKMSLDSMLPLKLSSTSCSMISSTNLLDGTIRLTSCSPVQTPQISTLWKQSKGRERKTSFKVSPPSGSNSPVPLKGLVVKCERVAAENYNVLKSPDNLPVKLPKPKRNRSKVKTVNKAIDKKGKGKTRQKRKRGDDSETKPRKKRKLSIPDHYKSYKPCQLPSIRHTNMRYRVAFDLWPQKFSGALDRINQRLMNQNSFWNSLR